MRLYKYWFIVCMVWYGMVWYGMVWYNIGHKTYGFKHMFYFVKNSKFKFIYGNIKIEIFILLFCDA